jgi:hypothetical protein
MGHDTDVSEKPAASIISVDGKTKSTSPAKLTCSRVRQPDVEFKNCVRYCGTDVLLTVVLRSGAAGGRWRSYAVRALRGKHRVDVCLRIG